MPKTIQCTKIYTFHR